MIDDHLIDKAAHAAVNTPVYGDKPTRERLADMHPEDAQAWRDTTRAALEAVAADIWEQGYQAGVHDEWEYQHDVPDTGLRHNPYLAT